MFNIFFPISGIFFDPFIIFATGLAGGFVSGFLGVGCGVIITPVLMELGVPPLAAVATQLCHAVGTNLSNFLSYKRKQDVDFHLAVYILIGGFFGAACEWATLKYSPSADTVFHKFAYVYIIILFIFGTIMLAQSIKTILKGNNPLYGSIVMMRRWMLYLPFHTVFKRSRTEMSVFVPIFVGLLAGIIVASLGGGNNLFMSPIITYLIGRISPVVQGTASLTGFVITAIVAMVYAERGYHCDFLFVMILFAGASIGSWLGVNLTYNIKRYYTNAIGAFVVFIMAVRMAFRSFGSSYTRIMESRIQDLSGSVIFQFAQRSSLIYTALCIFLICIVAVLSERLLQKLADKRQQTRKKRRSGK